jgi:four helix bundle protein
VLPFERFAAWRACHALTIRVYQTTREFPRDELYGMTSQVRRAAFSSGANIAEGSAKRGRREFRRYLDIAIGSLSEVGHALLVARDLGYLSSEQWKELDDLRDKAGKLVWGLTLALDGKKKSGLRD